MTNLRELNKLENYLRDNQIPYERIDQDTVLNAYEMPNMLERHQIYVPSRSVHEWDAICHWGSYGYEEGLLEIYGILVDSYKDGDSVVGWLTASDVIERIERKKDA